MTTIVRVVRDSEKVAQQLSELFKPSSEKAYEDGNVNLLQKKLN